MIHMFIIWWFFIIYVEAMTEIIVDSDFFFPIRNFLGKLPSFVGRFFTALLSCGYCVSVWVAASVAWMLPGSPTNHIELPICIPVWALITIDIVLKTLVLHRLSNVQHEIMVRILKRIPFFNPPMVDNQEIIVEENADGSQAGSQEGNLRDARGPSQDNQAVSSGREAVQEAASDGNRRGEGSR